MRCLSGCVSSAHTVGDQKRMGVEVRPMTTDKLLISAHLYRGLTPQYTGRGEVDDEELKYG
jgi:hypothetical protein